MRRLALIPFLVVALLLVGTTPSRAWLWGDDNTLVTINGEKHSTEDFKSWWQNWREQGMAFPETPQSFIEWQLLAKEAEKMELYREPSFQKKISVFLTARTLMLLKQEEIDAKMRLDEETLRSLYEKEYAPLLSVQILFFPDQQKAAAAEQQLQSNTLTVADLKNLDPAAGGPAHYQEARLRPIKIPPAWQEQLRSLSAEECSPPLPWGNGFAIVRLLERKAGDAADFDALKKGLAQKLRRQQQSRLTEELVQKLMKKYAVQINEDFLAALDVDNLSDELAETPIMTSSKGVLTAKLFVEKIRSQQNFQKLYNPKDKAAEISKQRILNNILAQTLTSWEALDRHYEKKPPFQGIFQFYQQNRLIVELKKRLFEPQAAATDLEIETYYQEHLEEFSRPETVTIAMVPDAGDKAKKFWLETTLGKDFFELAKQYYGSSPQSQTIPVNHLEPALKNVLANLAENDVSRPFPYQGHTALCKLLKHEAAAPQPLKAVANQISATIHKQKISALRTDYLKQLEAKSSISIDENAWRSLKKELGETDESKNQ